MFAPVTRHAWSQGRDSCDCNKSGGTKAYVSNIPQTSNRPSKKQEIKPEIICGPSPAGHGGRAEARSARVGSGFIPAAAHVEPSRERPEEESLSIQLDCTTLTQKNLKASDRTNPSGPYYKDTSQSEPTKQQKKTKKKGTLGSAAILLSAMGRQARIFQGRENHWFSEPQHMHIHIHKHVKTNPASLPITPSPSSTNPCSPSEVPNSREGPAAEDTA